MEHIKLPEIKCIHDSDKRLVLIIEPLHPGFGVTLGNSLRRTLLSCLEGGAITSVKIEGVSHEFSTLPNIKEDIVDVILNLKQLRLRVFGDEPVTLRLSAKKVGPVTAALIEKNPEVEIINTDLHICTLDNTKMPLEMEITVAKGRGYFPVEQREDEKSPLGFIAIDALFNPVTKVNYSVENTRVGGQTNLDKLTLEIETDGSITAREALDFSASVLVEHFGIFTSEGMARATSEDPSNGNGLTGEDIGKIKVEEVNLSTRTLNALLKNDIKTIDDVFKHFEDLASMPGLGARAVTEIKQAIDKLQSESKS